MRVPNQILGANPDALPMARTSSRCTATATAEEGSGTIVEQGCEG